MVPVRTLCGTIVSAVYLSLVCSELVHDARNYFPSPDSAQPAAFPRQFHANISTVAHLIDETRAYPPRRRLMEVWYDGIGKRAKIRVHEGYEANKTFLRRWDTQNEFAYRFDEYIECRRAFLSEPMPNYTLTSQHLRLRKGMYPIEIEGPGGSSGQPKPVQRAMMWVGASPEGLERIKMYATRDHFTPVRLTTEFAYEGRWDPVMTWTVENMITDSIEDWMFDVPEPWAAAPKKACKWVMGGWPQIHLFSHYLRV